MRPKYTRKVKMLADRIRKLTVGEMIALREALREDFDLPPDIGVREPRNPTPAAPTMEEKLDKRLSK